MTVAAPEQASRKARVMEELLRHPFRPPWWLRGRHLQTAWSHAFRRQPPPPVTRERWPTPDGDRLDVYLREGDRAQPAVLLLHGLEGSASSNYIVGLLHAFTALDWGTAVMEFRSCGGEINRARRLYHSGETGDLDFVVNELASRWPGRPLYLAGFSLGGNVAAKWLGECGEEAPESLAAAAVVSVPYDLAASADYFKSSLGGFYSWRFLRTLVAKAVEKERQFPGCIDVERVRRSRSFEEFDTHATAALHGFRDARDYWAQCSSGPLLGRIRRPTLLLSSADDPFNPASTLPREVAEASPWLHPLFLRAGGHVGFVCGPPWRTRHWAEEQIVRFFRLYEDFYRGTPPPGV